MRWKGCRTKNYSMPMTSCPAVSMAFTFCRSGGFSRGIHQRLQANHSVAFKGIHRAMPFKDCVDFSGKCRSSILLLPGSPRRVGKLIAQAAMIAEENRNDRLDIRTSVCQRAGTRYRKSGTRFPKVDLMMPSQNRESKEPRTFTKGYLNGKNGCCHEYLYIPIHRCQLGRKSQKPHTRLTEANGYAVSSGHKLAGIRRLTPAFLEISHIFRDFWFAEDQLRSMDGASRAGRRNRRMGNVRFEQRSMGVVRACPQCLAEQGYAKTRGNLLSSVCARLTDR